MALTDVVCRSVSGGEIYVFVCGGGGKWGLRLFVCVRRGVEVSVYEWFMYV